MHRPRLVPIAALLAGVLFAAPLLAHDLFLKLDSWCLAPNSPVTVDLFNGTFDRSDNVITRDYDVEL